MTDPRVSVHSVTFPGATLEEMRRHWRELGVSQLSLIDTQLDDPGLAEVIATEGYSVETVFHLFTTPDALHRRIDDAARVGARAVYMLTGGRGKASWGEAAERFCSVVAPCLEHADRAGVTLAIENASSVKQEHLALVEKFKKKARTAHRAREMSERIRRRSMTSNTYGR